jgi:hypothetical protein
LDLQLRKALSAVEREVPEDEIAFGRRGERGGGLAVRNCGSGNRGQQGHGDAADEEAHGGLSDREDNIGDSFGADLPSRGAA